MTDPEPWLVAHARTLLPPTQRGPQSPFAPSDATAVRAMPTPTTLAEKLHMLRMTAGGGAEGVARLPTDAVAMATMPIMAAPAAGSLRTVGRGEVRPSGLPSMASVLQPHIQRVLDAGEGAARSVGDFVGGAPQTSSEQDFRDMGSLAGNLMAWERLPWALRNLKPALTRLRLATEPSAATLTEMGIPKMQPFHEYQMRVESGMPIPPWLEKYMADQEARVAAQEASVGLQR